VESSDPLLIAPMVNGCSNSMIVKRDRAFRAFGFAAAMRRLSSQDSPQLPRRCGPRPSCQNAIQANRNRVLLSPALRPAPS
jgi:hypothetical protein